MRTHLSPSRTVRIRGRTPVPPVSGCSETWARLLGGRHLDPSSKVGILARIGRFEVVRSLGSGGMGVVMLAHDPEGRAATDNHSASGLVAIKIPRPELAGNARAIERFLTEANHMRQFGHPHILQVLEIGDSSTRPFIVMPHLRRGNLAEYLAKHSPLPDHEVLRLARELASALLHAHQHGIIHRDLKPANVLLNDRTQAVLTDFGLARTVFNEGIADIRSGHCEGTAPYMSPAVARGEAEDTRCDIYAFGALLYEMLAGRPPYTGPSLEHITDQILRHPPPRIRSLKPSAHVPLSRIAEWAMERELRHRYAHMVDLQDDLQRVEAGLPPLGPHGHRAPTSGLFRQSLVRRRLRPLLCTTVLLLFAAGVLLLCPASPLSKSLRRQALSTQAGHPFQTPNLPRNTWFLVQGQHLLMLRARAPAYMDVVHRFLLPNIDFQSSGTGSGTLQAEVDQVVDLDGDGEPELLLRAGDTRTRIFSALVCYSVRSGQLLWMRQDQNGFRAPDVVDLDDDGIPEILVTNRRTASPTWTISLLAPDGQTRHATHLACRPVSWRREPAATGTGWELVVLDENARLLVFDAQLRPRGSTAHAGASSPPP